MWQNKQKLKWSFLRCGILIGMLAVILCACGKEVEPSALDNQTLAFGETRTYWEDFVLTGEIKDWDQSLKKTVAGALRITKPAKWWYRLFMTTMMLSVMVVVE